MEDMRMNEQKITTVDGGFLQSQQWEAFQRALGRSVTMVSDQCGQALMIKYDFASGGWFFFRAARSDYFRER